MAEEPAWQFNLKALGELCGGVQIVVVCFAYQIRVCCTFGMLGICASVVAARAFAVFFQRSARRRNEPLSDVEASFAVRTLICSFFAVPGGSIFIMQGQLLLGCLYCSFVHLIVVTYARLSGKDACTATVFSGLAAVTLEDRILYISIALSGVYCMMLRRQLLQYLQQKRRAISNWYLSVLKANAHVGPGLKMDEAQKECGDIVKIEWFTSQIPGTAGVSLGARHSFLHVEVMDFSRTSQRRNIYILEKSANVDDWNGIRVSDTHHLPPNWRDETSDVGVKLLHCLHRRDIRRERGLTPRLATLVHRMSATGEYDLGMSNCHHAAQAAYNLSAQDETQKVNKIPNQTLVRIAAALRIGKKKAHESRTNESGRLSSIQSASESKSSGSSEFSNPVLDSAMKPGRHQHFNAHHPSTWCISAKQLFDFSDMVEQKWPGSQDPNAHQVSRDLISIATEESGLSYALQLNQHGLPIKYFVSHCWDYPTKKLIVAIKKVFRAKGEGNLWICFLANPQSWNYDDLAKLLGENVWFSPFAKALHDAESMIVVRDAEFNLYERLWCVLERALAEYWGKPLIVVGQRPANIADPSLPDRMGVKATCTDVRDRKHILSMLRKLPLLSPDSEPRSTDEIINIRCMGAVQEQSFEETQCVLM